MMMIMMMMVMKVVVVVTMTVMMVRYRESMMCPADDRIETAWEMTDLQPVTYIRVLDKHD